MKFNKALLLLLFLIDNMNYHQVEGAPKNGKNTSGNKDGNVSKKEQKETRKIKPTIEKKINKGTTGSPGKMKKKPHDVWVEGIRGGMVSIRISKPENIYSAAYAAPFYTILRDTNSHLCKKYSKIGPADAYFYKVLPLRSDDGDNVEMAAEPDSTYAYYQILFLFLKDEDNTPENREFLGREIAKDLNKIVEERYAYIATYEFAGDITEPGKEQDEYPPPATRLLDIDVMKLIDYQYPVTEYSRKVQSKELTYTFFGNREDAEEYILNFPY